MFQIRFTYNVDFFLAAVAFSFSYFFHIWPSSLYAETTNFAETARRSTIYIFFDVTNLDTGGISTIQGTGFVVSPNGYVLTASHLFSKWRMQSRVEQDKNLIRGTLQEKPEQGGEGPFQLQVISLGDANFEDIALLKLPQPISPGTYATANICLKDAAALKIGDDLVAYGFPRNENFQPVHATLGTQNAIGGRWAAASAFTAGMSGGPVYSTRGLVVGMVKGGLPDTDAVRWVTPLQHAAGFLRMAGVEEFCTSPPTKCSDESTARSPHQDTNPVEITVHNKWSSTIKAYWIDQDGVRTPYDSVLVNGAKKFRTFVGHPWVFTDETGNCLKFYMPNDSNADIFITSATLDDKR